MNHEVFMTESAVENIILKSKGNLTKQYIKNIIVNKCNEICSVLDIKKGMSVMLVQRENGKGESAEYLVFNQNLDGSQKAETSQELKNMSKSLCRNTFIFKPKGNKKQYLNKYISFNRLSSSKINDIVDANYKKFPWK